MFCSAHIHSVRVGTIRWQYIITLVIDLCSIVPRVVGVTISFASCLEMECSANPFLFFFGLVVRAFVAVLFGLPVLFLNRVSLLGCVQNRLCEEVDKSCVICSGSLRLARHPHTNPWFARRASVRVTLPTFPFPHSHLLTFPPSQWLQARTRTPEKLELTDKLAKAVVLHNLQVVLTPPPEEETKGGRRRFSFHEGAAPLMVPPLELDELAHPHFDRFNTGPSGPTVRVYRIALAGCCCRLPTLAPTTCCACLLN
jgi:hypothetical protein